VVLARMYECRLNGYCAAKPCICNGTVRNASIMGSHALESIIYKRTGLFLYEFCTDATTSNG
jgi:hypothetical protein